MLEALGLTPDDEAVYRDLLHHPRLTLGELAELSARGTSRLRRSLGRLEEMGVVSRMPGRPARYVGTRPDIAVDALVAQRHEELATLRTAARALLAELPVERRHAPEEQFEIVHGREAVETRFIQLQQTATEEVLVFVRPPYAQNPSIRNPGQDDLLTRGVRVRGIYSTEALEVRGAAQVLQHETAAGEEARTHSDVPLKLAIADGSTAILPLTGEQGELVDSALVIHAPTLVDALVRLFELLWKAAVPVPGAAAGPSSGFDRQLLGLLAAGLKDEAIARQLGVSLRTVQRRISDLMAELGARTRFQAGLAAARSGLFD